MWIRVDPNVYGAFEDTEVAVVPGGLLFKVRYHVAGSGVAVSLQFVPCDDPATWLEGRAA